MKQSNRARRVGLVLPSVLSVIVPVFALFACAKTPSAAANARPGPNGFPNDFIDVNRYALTDSSLSATEVKNPSTSYERDPNGLDYGDINNWFILPSRKTSNIDVFLIYPTIVFDEEKPDFISADDPALRENVENWVKDNVSPVFAGLNVNFYMPKYRQMNGKALGGGAANVAQKVNSVPKADVFNAFDFYLKHMNNFHDYIVFSHSQGSMLNGALMSEFASKYESPDVQKLMLCSYIIGYGLDDKILTASPYKPSTAPDDLNTLVSWNTATRSEVTSGKIRGIWGDETTVAVNPITFMAGGDAVPAGQNGFSLLQYFDDLVPIHVAGGLTGAQVVRPSETGRGFGGQVVLVDIDEHSFLTGGTIEFLDNFGLGYSHKWDIPLFAGSLRNNIIHRLKLAAN
jgi:hypothetical protein